MSKKLYVAQDLLLANIFDSADKLRIPGVILAGGTALSRYYLNHRISYDLDFFVPNCFLPEDLSFLLGKNHIILDDIHIGEKQFAAQLHGSVLVGDERIKLSFVEDIYTAMWPKVIFGKVVTEEIGGLYHRKLRTVSGSGYGVETKGARQTARDLFDIFILSTEAGSVSEFIKEINFHGANFPLNSFSSNMLRMPWVDLMDEFDLLEISNKYSNISFMGDVRKTLIDEALKIQNINDEPTEFGCTT